MVSVKDVKFCVGQTGGAFFEQPKIACAAMRVGAFESSGRPSENVCSREQDIWQVGF